MAFETVLHRTVRQVKIVNGATTNVTDFPYQVAIQNSRSEFLCGGTILSTFFILTAAHCVLGASRLRVKAGSSNPQERGTGQTRLVRYVFPHENYVQDAQVNDIALLMLNAPLEYTASVQNINLPRPHEEFDGYLTATGFGRLWSGGPLSPVLRKLTLPLVSNRECAKNYTHVVRETRVRVTDDMLCAGEPGRDTCQGDSGGPGACRRRDGSTVLCGVIVYGYGCGTPGFPGIYTKVSKYIPWIEEAQKNLIHRGKCRTNQFYCYSGSGCIPRSYICDNDRDCENGGEDESHCVSKTRCSPFYDFRCGNGRCVPWHHRCDGVDDCWDYSDEEKCAPKTGNCLGDQHQCVTGYRACIPNDWKCDGEQDCDDNSDEEGCPRPSTTIVTPPVPLPPASPSYCAQEEFYYCVEDDRCIQLSWQCDGDQDCPSGADERGCENEIRPIACSAGQFRCDSNDQCIYQGVRCDGRWDCDDGSDEENCEGNTF